MSKTPINSLDPFESEEHNAIAILAIKHGGKWRDMLKHLWFCSRDDTCEVWIDTCVGQQPFKIGGWLRRIRNTVGPHGLDKLHLADIAQVFEIVDGAQHYFRFNGWFVPDGGVWDDLDLRLMNTLALGNSLQCGTAIITRRA